MRARAANRPRAHARRSWARSPRSSGNDITVRTRGKRSTTVVYSSATTFKAMSGPGGTSSGASASALEVGSFIGANGTKNSDGSVTASSIVIGTGPPPAGNGAPATAWCAARGCA